MMVHRNWKQAEEGRRRREEILEAIERYIDEHGYSPTKAELAVTLGVSEETIYRHIKKLVAEGRLEEGSGPRTLRFPL